jgi:hypothetical protein
MSDIFVSYSIEDSSEGRSISRLLEEQGYSVFWGQMIPPGQTFEQVIWEELRAAKCVIVLWSARSVKSRWVRAEAEEALQHDKIISILLDDTRVPLQFRSLQYFDLSDWRGDPENKKIHHLIAAVRTLVLPS